MSSVFFVPIFYFLCLDTHTLFVFVCFLLCVLPLVVLISERLLMFSGCDHLTAFSSFIDAIIVCF